MRNPKFTQESFIHFIVDEHVTLEPTGPLDHAGDADEAEAAAPPALVDPIPTRTATPAFFSAASRLLLLSRRLMQQSPRNKDNLSFQMHTFE